MRPIKFRAFEKYRKIMCEVEELVFGENDDLQKISYYWEQYGEFLSTSDLDDVILMQYTTLKDKHGVEIYEGDIVKITNTSRFLGEEHTCYSEVRIIDGHVYVWVHPIIDGQIMRYGIKLLFAGMAKYIDMRGVATNDVEVVGDIYQNPELLEKPK